MIWFIVATVLTAALLVTIDGYSGFQVLRFVFGVTDADYGDGQGYSTLTWLLGIILTSGATFAASLQFNNDPFIPIVVYAAVSVAMVIGVGYVLRAKKKPSDNVREFSYGTILFGRWVQTTLIVLALIAITASLLGAVPGQAKKRKPYLQETISCSVQPADDPRLAGELFGVTSTRKQLDHASLNRWKSWMGSAKLADDQRLLYVQSEPFDSDYLPIQALIDFDNRDVVFEDAFIMHVQNSPSSTITPPIYRLLGIPGVPADVGQSNSTQIPLPMDLSSAHLPVFNVPAPNQGDLIAMFVIVKFREVTEPGKKREMPARGDERSMFLKLKRVN